MFVFLSKTLDLFLSPLTWSLLLLWVGAWRAKGARGGLFVAILVLMAFSFPTTSHALMAWAESGARKTWDSTKTYDAVILLGGGVDAGASHQSGTLELNAAGERVFQSYTLLLQGKAKHVLISAGTPFPQPGVPTEAELLYETFTSLGIASEKIVPEARSRNTRENATESAKIVAARGWKSLLLITSAAHMERALGCYWAVGLYPDTLPVDHRAMGESAWRWLPRAGALAMSTDALREIVGRWVYRLRGFTLDTSIPPTVPPSSIP